MLNGMLLQKGNCTYSIEKIIGQGSWGKVFEVTLMQRSSKKQRLAVKVLDCGNQYAETNAKRELSLLKSLHSCEFICNLFDHFYLKQMRFLILQYLPYCLGRLLVDQTVTLRELPVCMQILGGLSAIHRIDCVHRDIKPENIMMDEHCRVKLIDFGLTRSLNKNMTPQMCTLAYRAPEVLLEDAYGLPADVWAFALVLYETIAKKKLFSETTERKLLEEQSRLFNQRKIQLHTLKSTDHPRLEINLSADLRVMDVIIGCLHINPDKRYSIQNMDEKFHDIDIYTWNTACFVRHRKRK